MNSGETHMTSFNIARVTIVCLAVAHISEAQPPVRTAEVARNDTTRMVTLSLAEYNRLMDLADRPPEGTALAPVAAVLASANLRVRVDRETAHGVFVLAGDVLRPGVSKVPLVSGATLIEGTAAGRVLPLTADGPMHTALLPGPGAFALTLEWGAPLVFGPGRASFTLPVPPAGTARATIDLPGDQADLHISAGLITRRSTDNGRTLVDVTLRPGMATDVWWSMRDSAPVAAAREVRMLADVLSLLTLGDSDVRMVALIDVTVVQGEPRSIEIRLPAGYELTGISGSSLESSDQRDGGVLLTVDPAARRHQFLVSLERPHHGGSFTLDTGFLSVPGAQRERGEVAIEGVGTLELTAHGRGSSSADTEASIGGLHRIDVRELNGALQSLARQPILSAFRYQRNPTTPAGLTMDVKRFADVGVLAAVADRAVATTLVTTEGRALTEIVLTVQNRAQPFLKVALPAGATMVSVEVAGGAAKPVMGADGTRVPLLRPGCRPNGTYSVSFVYLHYGTPFLKKGDFQMTLPKMDIPVGIVEWEVFVPERYAVRAIDGNVIDRMAFPAAQPVVLQSSGFGGGTGTGRGTGVGPGTAGGIVGGVKTVEETVTVAGQDDRKHSRDNAQRAAVEPPSQNVINLQRRAAGVLPVRVDVPRAGVSHQFVKPLVVDQETVVSLKYKRR